MKSPDVNIWTMLTIWIRTIILTLFLVSPQAIAVEIMKTDVSENNGEYVIHINAVVDAPSLYVRAVLTDYLHLYRLNPSIIENTILLSPREDIVRVKTRIIDCVIFICVDLIRVEDVEEISVERLRADIVSSLSNFHSGQTDWTIQSLADDRSTITYKSTVEPDFYIPPAIGTFIVKHRFKVNVIKSLIKLECIAKIRQELDWNPELQITGNRIETQCQESSKPETYEDDPY